MANAASTRPVGTATSRLEGRRLVLRPLAPVDVSQRYCDWLNDPEVNRYLETRYDIQTIESVSAYVDRIACDPSQILWAICTAGDSGHIGNIKLGPVNPHHRTGDMSLFIGEKAQWGRGHGVEAIGLVCDYAFGVLGLNKLKAGAYAENTASIRAFEKCGFRHEGRLREHAFSEGRFTDVVLLGKLASDPAHAAA